MANKPRDWAKALTAAGSLLDVTLAGVTLPAGQHLKRIIMSVAPAATGPSTCTLAQGATTHMIFRCVPGETIVFEVDVDFDADATLTASDDAAHVVAVVT